jgi:polar amino acid transport system substrate-binding protein
LRVGLEAGYMPFEMRDKGGDIIGFDVDLARLMARKLGVKLAVVNQSWDGIVPALLTGKFDVLMGGMTITEERAKRVAFTEPYFQAGLSALLNRKLEGKVKSADDLNQPEYRIVAKLGTTGEVAARKFFPRASLRTFEHEADAVIEVRGGRADAFIYDFPSNAIYAAQSTSALLNLAPPFKYEDLGWAVRKGDPVFVAWLNEFLAEIRRNGSYAAFYKKWFENSAWLANIN